MTTDGDNKDKKQEEKQILALFRGGLEDKVRMVSYGNTTTYFLEPIVDDPNVTSIS